MLQADTIAFASADSLAARTDSLLTDSLAVYIPPVEEATAEVLPPVEIRPMEEAFPGSVLKMLPSEPAVFPHDTAAWDDNPVNSILALAFILIFLLNLRNFLDIIPSIARCSTRWKENLNIDASVQLMRVRNIAAAILVVPFCMIADRFEAYVPFFAEGLPHWTGCLPVIAAAIAYIALRQILVLLLRPKRSHDDVYMSMHRSSYNWFILLCMVTFPTVAVLSLCGLDAPAIRRVFLIETAAVYTLFLIGKLQISASFCTPLTTFLYLCTLEMLPTGLLVASAVLR